MWFPASEKVKAPASGGFGPCRHLCFYSLEVVFIQEGLNRASSPFPSNQADWEHFLNGLVFRPAAVMKGGLVGSRRPTLGPTSLRSAAFPALIGRGELRVMERPGILVLICPFVRMHLHCNVRGVPGYCVVVMWRARGFWVMFCMFFFLLFFLIFLFCSQAVVSSRASSCHTNTWLLSSVILYVNILWMQSTGIWAIIITHQTLFLLQHHVFGLVQKELDGKQPLYTLL